MWAWEGEGAVEKGGQLICQADGWHGSVQGNSPWQSSVAALAISAIHNTATT